MNEIIKNIEAAQLKETVPSFNVGDTVRVSAKIKEGNRERIQVFELDYDSDEDGYVSLSQIGDLLSRLYTDFDTRNYGFSKLHKLVDSTGLFETKCELLPGGGKKLVVRNL